MARRIMLTGFRSQVAYLNEQFVPSVISISPQYVRDADPNLDPLIQEMAEEFERIGNDTGRRMDQLHRDQADDHTEQWIEQVQSALGIDISSIIDATLERELRLWSSNTAGLITKVNADLVSDISRETRNALRLGQSQAQLARTLQLQYTEALHGKHVGRTEESRKRAMARKRLAAQRHVVNGSGTPAKYWSRYEIIARDQVTTLRSNLDRVRQIEAGLDKYKWKDADDSRVRSTHRSRDNITYSWKHNHDDGHPGEPVLCRCIALAVVD